MNDRATCRWVSERLPLFVEPRDDLMGDQGDLGPEDCGRIERHLADCPSCRSRRASLEEVRSILGLVAEEEPVEPSPGSLLPALNARIHRQQEQARSPWARLVSAAAAPLQAVAGFRSEWPLRLAWMRDSLHERVHGIGAHLRDLSETVARELPPLGGLRPDPRAALALAGMVLGAFLLAGTAHHRQAEAQARIRANAGSIPGMVVARREAGRVGAEPIVIVEAEPAEPGPTGMASGSESVAIALATTAQAPAPTPATPRPAGPLNSPVSSTPPAPSSAVAASPGATSPRFDFDLEHGTPMPPENRVGKPAY